MPEIFHTISDRNVGGAGIFLCNLLSHSEENQGSTVLLPAGSLLCSRLRALGIPYIEYPALSGGAALVRYFKALFCEKGASLVVSHASLPSRIAAKVLHIPTLSVKHCDTSIPALSVPFYNALTDATVATSRPAAIRLRQRGVKNVFAIENGITPIGVPSEEERQRARAHFGVPSDRLMLGLVGRLSPIKGHKTALRALAYLGEAQKHFLLCFLGEGESKESLLREAKELDVCDCVRFFGFSPDTRRFYHALDGHLSCSTGSETSSLSLAEGLSAGCPTIASDTPGNRERLGSGGVLFPVKDARALSALFLRLRDPLERRHLSTLALARASTLPAWEQVRRDYRRITDAFCGDLVRNGCNFRKDMI